LGTRNAPTASLRDAPTTNSKTLVEVEKGNGLAVVENKGQ